MNLRFLAPVGALAALSTAARGDLITGRIVDAQGVGVAGVNIDAINLANGSSVTLANDGTDAAGFFSTTIPAGVYDVLFVPPAPPLSTFLVRVESNVVVSGTKAFGTLALTPGVSLALRCIRAGNIPVAGVNVDVIDDVTNQPVITPNDTSDSFGNLLIAVPAGPIEVRLIPGTVPGVTLAPKTLHLAPTANTNLGDVLIPQGLTITGHVQRTNGNPLANVDVDVEDAATHQSIYVQGDTTDASGNFSILLGAGTYDIDICPSPSLLLVASDFDSLVVSANTNLGTIVLVPGVTLTGTVTAQGGGPVAGVDVNVRVSATQESITLCGDNTNASGAYSVVVPTGTFDVKFTPPASQPLGSTTVPNVVVNGASVQSGVLPPCSFGTNYGTGRPGTGGFVPHVQGFGGAPRAGNDGFGWQISNGRGSAIGMLVFSRVQLNVPLFGGTLLVHPGNAFSAKLPFLLNGAPGVGGAGSRVVLLPVPTDLFVGETWYQQAFIVDAGAGAAGIAMTEGLTITFCP